MSMQDRIIAASSRNTSLLYALAETDYAEPALKQHQVYVDDLNKQLRDTKKLLNHLAARTQAELKDHEKYRDSTMRRFAYRIGGKRESFESKASKEEKEYFDALNEEHHAKQKEAQLNVELLEASKMSTDLAAVKEQHDHLQRQLDSLYNSIFEGPSPDFPYEDKIEEDMHQAKAYTDQAEYAYRTERQVVSILTEAMKAINEALQEMTTALNRSDLDMFNVGGVLADISERKHLEKAQDRMAMVQTLVQQASRLQPEVRLLRDIEIATKNMMSDVIFDNVFSDYHFHKKIKAGNEQMLGARQHLGQQLTAAQHREMNWAKELETTKIRLDETRQTLQKVRMDAFQIAQGYHGGYVADTTATAGEF
ncbi:MAG: hypothetical protein Q9227_007762 [Pyrenula ochraceoflavens]